MSSGAPAHVLSPKAVGTSVEADSIQTEPLEAVPDRVATWYDARTTDVWTPSRELPFLGIAVIEPGTVVEIKAASAARSNGTRDTPGHWYIKRDAHERLLADAGVYLLVVYDPRPSTPVVARVVIPASLLDEHLSGRWYDVDDPGRTESEVVQLSWTTLIDRDDVDSPGGESA